MKKRSDSGGDFVSTVARFHQPVIPFSRPLADDWWINIFFFLDDPRYPKKDTDGARQNKQIQSYIQINE